MKKILGLDLGTTSIGWAVISEDDTKNEILGLGCRIIPYSENEAGDFKQGTGESKNHQRTIKRTQRKGNDRYQLRRKALREVLMLHSMMPDESMFRLNALELYGLRAKAVAGKIEPEQIGRILFHLNQRRGYKHGIKEDNDDKKQREFVEKINNRYAEIAGKYTIGQYFYEVLQREHQFRIKEKIFPRQAYINEFDEIWKVQSNFYPAKLTQELKTRLRDEIIYYQRPLKSQKRLVSICEFEGFWTENKKNPADGRLIFAGPHVAPKSSPIFQICKIWESINNILIARINPETRKYENVTLDINQKTSLFLYLDEHENLSEARMFEILGFDRQKKYVTNALIRKRGIQGNLTKSAILKAIKGNEFPVDMLSFNIEIAQSEEIDRDTGEVVIRDQVKPEIEKQPLFNLWHCIYSIHDREELKKLLELKFGIKGEAGERLATLDFTKGGYGNKSSKAMRRLLPYLMQGYVYSDACLLAGYNHSDSLTTEEKRNKVLLEKIKILPPNTLRQPVVEKILNQMINVVNAVISHYGRPDEIRVELARELRQSKQERNEYYTNASTRDRQNQVIADRLEKEYGVRGNRKNIEKWRLFHEVGGMCLYCDRAITITQVLTGIEADVEHIIPKSVYFDDSFSNKTISHVSCNKLKGSLTAYDYMSKKTVEELDHYIQRVTELFHTGGSKADDGAHCLVNKISRTKYQRLLMERKDIPQDFITRQLRETQYISRKSREILEQAVIHVFATSGSVTEKLRHLWGWDEILHNLQLPKYRSAGLTEWKEISNNGPDKKETIPGWSKRNDNRHHAIDALTVASTRQGFIQRINTLNSEHTREEMLAAVRDLSFNEKLTVLEKYLVSKRPFDTNEVTRHVSRALISFKSGKKVATRGKRKCRREGTMKTVQTGIIVPRGPLSEESVYGKIRVTENAPLKRLFENPDLIVSQAVREKIITRLAEHGRDPKKAYKSCVKDPICLKESNTSIEFARIFKEEYVIKYPVASIKAKDLNSIVDPVARKAIEERLMQFNNKEKDAFRDLEKNPIWYNEKARIPIRSVRCFTGLSSVVPLKIWPDGSVKGYVKPGSNHHIAIYLDRDGVKHEHVVTFWHAVERRKYGIPAIIENTEFLWSDLLSKEDIPAGFLEKLPEDGWKLVLSMQQNEMFLMGLPEEECRRAMDEMDYEKLSNHLYRVQKIAASYYTFRNHLETMIDDSLPSLKAKRFIRIQSLKALDDAMPFKVKINLLGKLSFQKR